MNKLGSIIRNLREEQKLPLRKVAASLEMDQAVLSKIERGKRRAPRALLKKLSELFSIDPDVLQVAWMADKITGELQGEELAQEVLEAAEEYVVYSRKEKDNRKVVIEKIGAVLRQFHQIRRGWLFGSFARGEATPSSDIDVLIEVDTAHPFTLFDLAELQDKITSALKRKTDVVMERMLKPGIRENIVKDATVIYEA
jgi:predicted nucleotidyltransferase